MGAGWYVCVVVGTNYNNGYQRWRVDSNKWRSTIQFAQTFCGRLRALHQKGKFSHSRVDVHHSRRSPQSTFSSPAITAAVTTTIAAFTASSTVSYTHLTLPTTPYV